MMAGCSGSQSTLNPASEQARQIGGLWWLFLIVCGTVWLAVVAMLAAALWRARRGWVPTGIAFPPPLLGNLRSERRATRTVVAAVAFTSLVLVTFLAADFLVSRALAPPSTSDALTIRITGHQWWWDIRYEHSQPSKLVQTANELHVPVGRPIHFILQSADVIHSFWFPNLQGKKDLIPGQPTSLWMTIDEAGVYRGQCAEFCGHQHANMRLLLVAEPAETFEPWLDAQRQPAREPTTESQRRGREVFLRSSCVMCHTIGGTPAQSRVGPTLTHFGSRQTLGAGAAPNQRGHLAGWILDPQRIKPGVRMPPNPLAAEDLHPLLDYLESLE